MRLQLRLLTVHLTLSILFFLFSCNCKQDLIDGNIFSFTTQCSICNFCFYDIYIYLLYNTQLSDITTGVVYRGTVSVACNALLSLVEFRFVAVSSITCNALKSILIVIGRIFDGVFYV